MHPDAETFHRFLQQQADTIRRLIEESKADRPQLSPAEVEQFHKAEVELIADSMNSGKVSLAARVFHNHYAGHPFSRA